MGLTVISILVLVAELVTIFGFVLLERRQPAATLAWLLAVLLLPVLGMVLYLLIGGTKVRRARMRSRPVVSRIAAMLEAHPHVRAHKGVDAKDYRTRAMLKMGNNFSKIAASGGNRARLLVNARATYSAMLEAIDKAEDHIHVEFYIIQPDETGENLREHLVARAKAGITVRVLGDAVGCMGLPSDFWAPLIEAGGQAATFGPFRLTKRMRRRDRWDFRNHRKIVIVDGRIGFTGGINVGREYLGLNPELGHWRDTHMEIEGPSVLGMQRTFAEDWLRTTSELIDEPRYYPEPDPDVDGECLVQIIDSGPESGFAPIQQLFFTAMTQAQERLWITSPYFVPDLSIEQALMTAALRGVDVRLLLPRRSDSRLVTLAGRSYYRELLEAGVRIFEYERGFVHAKTLVVDNWLASVGSANMDIRSFHLNYETNAFVFGAAFVEKLAGTFTDDLEHTEEISLERVRKLAYSKRLLQASARLLSPLL